MSQPITNQTVQHEPWCDAPRHELSILNAGTDDGCESPVVRVDTVDGRDHVGLNLWHGPQGDRIAVDSGAGATLSVNEARLLVTHLLELTATLDRAQPRHRSAS